MSRELANGIALALGVTTLAVGGPWLVAHLKTLPPRAELMARADAKVVALSIGGMTCQGCAAKVQGELSTVPGVSAVRVSWEPSRATVVCDKTVPDSALTAAVSRAGPSFLAAITRP